MLLAKGDLIKRVEIRDAVGANLMYWQTVGIKEQTARYASAMPQVIVAKAIDRLNFGPALAGKIKHVAVYDLGGRLLNMKTIAEDYIDLWKDFGIRGTLCIVRIINKN
jgi:hypothetical protein